MGVLMWQDVLVDQLSALDEWTYPAGTHSSTEPAAFSTLALIQFGRLESAARIANWIAGIQSGDGSVGINRQHATPTWPTSLAMLAWYHLQKAEDSGRYQQNLADAKSWALSITGKQVDPEKASYIGHDTMLIGWPWVQGTHSWMEPTAFYTWAFKTIGLHDHSRTREAVRLLLDRQLPQGGCNYGNTFILGQRLLPHLQPSGIAMMAMHGEDQLTEKQQHAITRTAAYLNRSLQSEASLASFCFGALGLIALGRADFDLKKLLRSRYGRQPIKLPSAYQLALVLLASAVEDSILFGDDHQHTPGWNTNSESAARGG